MSSHRGSGTGASDRRGRERLIAALVALLTLGHVGLLWRARLLPFGDVPVSLAIAAVTRHLATPGAPPAPVDAFVRADLTLRPNLFQVHALASPLFPDPETACRVWLSFYVVLWPAAVWVLLRVTGGDPAHVLLALVLLWSAPVTYGLLGFALALPLLVLSYALVLDDGATLGRLHELLVAALLVALFGTHVLVAGVAAALHLLVAVRRRWPDAPRVIRSVAPTVPLALLVGAWLLIGGVGQPGPAPAAGSDVQSPWWVKVFTFPVSDVIEITGAGGAALLWGLVVIGLVVSWRALRRGEAPAGTAGLSCPPLWPLLAVGLGGFFLLPHHVGDLWLSPRFGPVAMVGLLAVAARRLPAPGRRGVALLAAAAALHLGLTAGWFAAFHAATAGLTRDFFPDPAGGARLGTLIGSARLRFVPLLDHVGNYYTVWRLGPCASHGLDGRFGPVRRAVPESVLPRHVELAMGEAYDGRYRDLEYVLAQGALPAAAAAEVAARPVVRSAGGWTLYGPRRDRRFGP